MPAKCPTCGKPPIKPHKPFCSERCASVDLGRWFSGKYAFASNEPPENEELDAIIEALEGGGGTDGASPDGRGNDATGAFADEYHDGTPKTYSSTQIMPFPRKQH